MATKKQLKKWRDGGMGISGHQCEATLTYMGTDCSRSARYKIDGIMLCTQHAGPIAIQKLLISKSAKKLDVINPYDNDPQCDYRTMFDYRIEHNLKL